MPSNSPWFYYGNTLSISSDGRYVVFASYASNLSTDGVPPGGYLFIHDRVTGTTERLPLGTGLGLPGTDSAALRISDDGRFATFTAFLDSPTHCDKNNFADVFGYDTTTGRTELISVSTGGVQGNGDSASPSVSGDGTRVAFVSQARTLVASSRSGTFSASWTRDLIDSDRVTY